MSQVLSSVISDHTVTFFAQARIFTIQSDHINYKTIRDQLIADPYAEADPLIELADVRVAIANADPEGLLRFIGDTLSYKDRALPLANVWVQKIMGFRAQQLNFEPIFKGLDSLMRNPSMRARERFPLFAEASAFGFLKDGRMGAFKAVRSDFKDIHSGQFDNSPGQILSMPREDVDDDAEKTCSAGFHLGALSYVQAFGHITTNGDTTNKVVFCAFWPEHVVAIPVDYDGKPMRVWQYEVLEEVASESVQEFLKAREFAVPDTKTPYQKGYAHGGDEQHEGAECDPNPEVEAPELDENDYDNYRRGYRKGYSDAENGLVVPDDKDPI
jgi:hypothetical protein